jgi:ribonuclease Z
MKVRGVRVNRVRAPQRLVGAAFALVLAALAPLAAHAQQVRVTLLGTGTPILNIDRFGMSTLVEVHGQKLLFDAGRGVAIRLHQRKVALRDVDGIFLTHLHSDHISGLPDLYATAPLPTDDGRRSARLELWGPEGVDQVARGVELMFGPNNRFRSLGGEVNEVAKTISVHQVSEGTVYDRDGVRVSAFLVDHGHAKPAFGYRIDYGRRSVVISGDTTYSPNLVAHAKGADILIHRLAAASRKLEAADPAYVARFYASLANPEVFGTVMNQVKPKLAIASHISLYSKGDIGRASEAEIKRRVGRIYRGPFIIGEDLMSFVDDDHGVSAIPYTSNVRQKEP